MSALGVVPEKPTFPAVVDCPFCHQPTFYLFDDIPIDGVWAHCEACKAHGDILALGAQIWNTSIADALDRFADLGCADRGSADHVSGSHLRATTCLNTAEAFWAEAEAQIWNHDDDVISCRLRELGLESSLDSCRGLVGVAHPDQVAALCRAIGRATPHRMRENGPSLVMPYYALPGRLTGFLITQYNDEFMSRRAFVALAGHDKRRAEAGYFMLHTAMLPPNPSLRNSYFVTDDPFAALRMQCGQLKTGISLLPIAAGYSGPEAVSTGLSWQSLAYTPRLFHSGTYSADVISQACAARGYVCVLPAEQVQRAATPSRNRTRLATIRGRAQTWQTALEHVLANTNETAAQAFVTRLTIDLAKIQQFFRTRKHALPAEFCERLLTQVKAAPGGLAHAQKKLLIIERDGGWWSHANDQICSAQIRINKVVHAESGEKLYSGVVLLGDRELPFDDRAEKIERMGLLAYAAQHASADGLLVLYDRRWNMRAARAAMQLHPPEIVHVSGRGGWNARNDEFSFRNYALTNNGGIKPCPYPRINVDVPDFPEPIDIAPITLHHVLTPSYENALLWSAFGVVAAGLLAPIVNRAALPTGCAGDDFQAALAVGESLRCPHVRVTTVQCAHAAGHAVKTANGDWPGFVSHTHADRVMNRSVIKVLAGPAIVRLPQTTALVATGYGWQFLRGTPPAAPPDLAAMRYVLPAYIQRCLQQRMQLVTRHDNLTTAVLTDLAAWLKDIYGGSFNLACALNRLATPARAHEALMEVVDLGITAGKLDVIPRPRRKDQPGNFLLRNKQHWWLNQKAIDRYCVAVGGISPNWPAVTQVFERAGVYRGADTVHNMHGILVDKDFCDRFWSDYNANARALG